MTVDPDAGQVRGLGARLLAGIRSLHPAYFALVMATGIVAIAANHLDFPAIANALTWLNIFAFLALWLATAIRIARYRDAFVKDFADHNRGVGFFTIVAGTCVLGSQLVLIWNSPRAALALWFLGIALWFMFIYGVFTALTIKEEKPPLENGLNGGWLVAVVATQSVSILGTLLLPQFDQRQDLVLFLCLCWWLFGGMLYLWIISLIFYRYTFFRLDPATLVPPYWINMGAMAISTLAGANLINRAEALPMLASMLPFVKGTTLLYWATATWWIPMLLLLGFWRHVVKHFALRYDPLYWGAVFPLGMYSACSYQLGQALEFPPLQALAQFVVYVAFAAWLATFCGMVARWTRLTVLAAREVRS